MRAIFLRPAVVDAVKAHHKELKDGVLQFAERIEERVSLYDLLLEPARLADKEQWQRLQEIWITALDSSHFDTVDFQGIYDISEAKVKRTLLPFVAQMRRKSTLWQAITSPEPEPDVIVDATRFTVHWAVLQAVKRLWLFKSATEHWSNKDYVGLPAMTTPVMTAATLLFGEGVKGNTLLAKTIHTRLATELDKSEIWVNSALQYFGQRVTDR
jgi:hypothetical protein